MTVPARYTLYGAPTRASLAPQIVLEELGVDYRDVVIDLDAGAHKTAEFLRLNPSGRVPVLVDGELAVSEAAAICLHLADQHPAAGLLAPPASHDRGRAYQILLFLATTVQPTLMEYFYPARYAPDAAGEPHVMAHALTKLASLWRQLDGELCGNVSVLARGFGVCDAYLYMLASWHRDTERPLTAYEHLWRVVTHTAARPAVRRVAVAHGPASTAWWHAAVAMDPGLCDRSVA
jgi:glutathione S-transferase